MNDGKRAVQSAWFSFIVVVLSAVVIEIMLSGCSAGNVYGYKASESVLIGRVSECVKPGPQHMDCIHRGQPMRFDAGSMWWDKVSFKNTILSPPGSDVCQEMGWLCP